MDEATLLKYFPKSKRAMALSKGKKFVAKEGAEQIRLIQWLNLQYPNYLWSFDLAGASDVIAGKASDYRPSGFKMPDFQLMVPRMHMKKVGLFLELKKTDFNLYVTRGPRKGEMIKNEHIETQAESLRNLRANWYWADFAAGEEDARRKITAYVNGDLEELLKLQILK